MRKIPSSLIDFCSSLIMKRLKVDGVPTKNGAVQGLSGQTNLCV